jgi:hypothetical protein
MGQELFTILRDGSVIGVVEATRAAVAVRIAAHMTGQPEDGLSARGATGVEATVYRALRAAANAAASGWCELSGR